MTASKIWLLSGGTTRPRSITVYLLRDGQVDRSVVLSDANGWTHTWSGLDDQYSWTVREEVPEGFSSRIERNGWIFSITNSDIPPDNPGGGGNTPGDGDDSPGGGDNPGEPGTPPDSSWPPLPKMGDSAGLRLTLGLLGLVAFGATEVEIIRRKRCRRKKEKDASIVFEEL